ncbi:MAG: Fur family transcriptional regulator [Actinomycetota bacterium]
MSELDDVVLARLVASDQRFTPARRALVAALRSAGGPVSIQEIQRLTDDLPQSSVYRNLSVLEAAGVVTRIVGNDEFGRFELAEDLIGHHHHLLCEECGAMLDVTVPPAIEKQLDEALAKLAESSGFTLHHHRLDLVGRCAKCK